LFIEGRPPAAPGRSIVRFGVGLWCLSSTATSPRHHVAAYRELLEDARELERLGYWSMWLSEHHFFYDGYCPALLPAAAGALAVTDRLEVATGMLLLPLQRPDRLRDMAVELSDRSGGRFQLGVGLGYRDVEFDGKGVPRAERLARQREGLELLERDVTVAGPPLWIGSATPAGVRRAGARGAGILLSGANPLPMVAVLAREHRLGWEAAGRPGGTPPRVAALRNVWVTDDAAEREAAIDWFRSSYVVYAGLGWSVAEGEAHERMDFSSQREGAMAQALETVIIGSAGEVVDGLREVAAAGVDDVVFRVVLDGCPQAALHHQLRRLATEVLPALGAETPAAASAEGAAVSAAGGAASSGAAGTGEAACASA
jgi:alkanesulfonate monooxygenase SsuD/methylene tetrahydromethanopterin reductase-like flavin-dependent oxidoreductase (luciferase family)